MENNIQLKRQSTIVSDFSNKFLNNKKKTFTREEIESFIKEQAEKEKELLKTIWDGSKEFEKSFGFEKYYQRVFGDIKQFGITEYRPVMFTTKENDGYKKRIVTRLGFWIEYFDKKDDTRPIAGSPNCYVFHGSETIGNPKYGIISNFSIADWEDIIDWEYVDYDKLFPWYKVSKLQNIFLPIGDKTLMKKFIKVYTKYVKSEKLFDNMFQEYSVKENNIREYILKNIKHLEDIVSKCGSRNNFPTSDGRSDFNENYFWINNRGVLYYGHELPEYRHTGRRSHNDFGINKLQLSQREEDKKEPKHFMFTEKMLNDFVDFQKKSEQKEITLISDFKVNKLHLYTGKEIFNNESTKEFIIENCKSINDVENFFKENKPNREYQQHDFWYTDPVNFEKETTTLYGCYFIVGNKKYVIGHSYRKEYQEFDESKIFSDLLEYGDRYVNQLAKHNWKHINELYQEIINNDGKFIRQFYVAEIPQVQSMFLKYKL